MQRLWINQIEEDFNNWSNLLKKLDLKTEKLLDQTYGIYEKDSLIATGSIYSNVIKCIAIDENYQGGTLFNELISFLMNKLYELGHSKIYVYTKPTSEKAFSFLGFKKIESVEDKLVFMENSVDGFDKYINNLRESFIPGKNIGSIVMNANPFTKGHLYLIEQAKSFCDVLHIFIVDEDISVFDFKTRKTLVKLGTSHLDNIFIHNTNSYMISSQTFPSYFFKEDVDVTKIQATLDARIFKYSISKALGINIRFVGDEPFSKTTDIYNKKMKEIFENEPKLIIVKRLQQNDIPISASTVRNLIALGKIEEVKNLVPQSTFNFLISKEAESIVSNLKTDPLLGQKLSY